MLLGRLVAFYQRIVFLSRLSDSVRRGGVFASNAYFRGKVTRKATGDSPAPRGFHEATYRRWIAILSGAGWLRSVVAGPTRLLIPIATPEQIVGLLPDFARLFARLLKGVLRGKGPSSLYRIVDTVNSNNSDAASKPVKKPTVSDLPEADRSVAAQCINAGVSEDQVVPLIQRVGRKGASDALEALRETLNRGKVIRNPGGWLAEMARKLHCGDWSLPGSVCTRWERQEEREQQRAARIVRAPKLPSETPKAERPPEHLLEVALAQVLAETSVPILRKRIEELGVESPAVLARARKLQQGVRSR